MEAIATGQAPAKVPRPEDDTTIIGKHHDDVVHGSRLRRMIETQGGDADASKATTGKKAEPVSDSRLALIMQGKRAIRRFTWPGSDIEAGIVVLTAEEIQEAAIAASERLKDVATVLGMAYVEQLQHEISVQTLWRATIDIETGRPFALTPDELRRNLPTDVLSYLVGIYNDWQSQLSPLDHPSITDAEGRRIIDALKKNPKAISTAFYDAASLRRLLMLSVSPPTDSPSSNS